MSEQFWREFWWFWTMTTIKSSYKSSHDCSERKQWACAPFYKYDDTQSHRFLHLQKEHQFLFFYPSTSNTIFLILSTSFKKILIAYFWLLGIKCIGERTHLRAFGNRVMSNDCWNVIWTEVFFLIQYWCKLLIDNPIVPNEPKSRLPSAIWTS